MDGCYRLIKTVDIEAVRLMMGRLPFMFVNQGSKEKGLCKACIETQFPPELKDFVKGLELGGRQARAVLRMLPRKQGIPPHQDKWMGEGQDWKRFQLPIVTHPSILMRWPDDQVTLHLEAGNLYEVNFNKTHEVVNEQDEVERIHLQIDQIDATI